MYIGSEKESDIPEKSSTSSRYSTSKMKLISELFLSTDTDANSDKTIVIDTVKAVKLYFV